MDIARDSYKAKYFTIIRDSKKSSKKVLRKIENLANIETLTRLQN